MAGLVSGSFSGFGQRSLDLPIAPQNIPSWVPLLQVRSRPTCRRHVIIRSATALGGKARLIQTVVSVS